MIYGRIPPLSNTNRGLLNPELYTKTGAATTNADFLRLLAAQMATPNLDTLLFGTEEEQGTSLFGGVIGGVPSSASPLFGGFSLGGLPSEYTGQTSLYSGFSPQMELSIWSNLIGKKVEVVNPQTGETMTGKVDSVVLSNGQVMLDVEGTLVPTGNLLKVM